MSYVYDGLAALVDLLHLAIIVFAMTGGAFPRYRFPVLRRVHHVTLMVISIGIVLLKGSCWLTEVALWLRIKAHPEDAQDMQTFAQKVASQLHIQPVILLSVTLLIFVGSMVAGAIQEGNHIKKGGRL